MRREYLYKITIERMIGILKDIVWIGINNHIGRPINGTGQLKGTWLGIAGSTLMHPVKFLVNSAVNGQVKDIALRMAATPSGCTRLCAGLTLFWQHVHVEGQGVVIELIIGGRDTKERGYFKFLTEAKNYFNHLNETGSRTF